MVWWLSLVMWTAAVIGEGVDRTSDTREKVRRETAISQEQSKLQLRSIRQKNRRRKTFLLAPVRRF